MRKKQTLRSKLDITSYNFLTSKSDHPLDFRTKIEDLKTSGFIVTQKEWTYLKQLLGFNQSPSQKQNTPKIFKNPKSTRKPCVRRLVRPVLSGTSVQNSKDKLALILRSLSNPHIRTVDPQNKQTDKKGKKASALVFKLEKFLKSLNRSNGMKILMAKGSPVYRFFIGTGNNDLLVNHVMRTRPWWTKVHSNQHANFIWTQNKQSKICKLLPKIPQRKKKVNLPKEQGVNLNLVYLKPRDSFVSSQMKIYNRLQKNNELTSKKRLFKNLKAYYEGIGEDPFEKIPLTFHIEKGREDSVFQEFACYFQREPCFWIVKPGECSNRGTGISVCKQFDSIVSLIKSKSNKRKSYIIQKYIQNPLLFKQRKFDIRIFVLITSFNGNLQAYFYKQGYLRTSSCEFSMADLTDKFTHLTNDAIQKNSLQYGKFESGNKLSLNQFQKYLKNEKFEVNFGEDVLEKIKKLVIDSVKATCWKLDPNRRGHSFQVLGYDFMLDDSFHPWLIEVNTNPCLAVSGTYLAYLIPKMIEDTFQMTIDTLFPPINCKLPSTYSLQNNYQLIYNRAVDKREVLKRSLNKK